MKDKAIAKQIHKNLKRNVLDENQCTPAQKVVAKIGLVIGLWGPFLAALIICFLCSRDVVGESREMEKVRFEYVKNEFATPTRETDMKNYVINVIKETQRRLDRFGEDADRAAEMKEYIEAYVAKYPERKSEMDKFVSRDLKRVIDDEEEDLGKREAVRKFRDMMLGITTEPLTESAETPAETAAPAAE